MPPSGYNKIQANLVADFLDSISGELKRESLELDLLPKEGLIKEIGNINKILTQANTENIKVGVLDLTKYFYEIILDKNPLNWESFDSKKVESLEKVKKCVLDIKVDKLKSI